MINSDLEGVKSLGGLSKRIGFLLLGVLLFSSSLLKAEEITVVVDRPTFSFIPVRVSKIEGPPGLSSHLLRLLEQDLNLHLVFNLLREPSLDRLNAREYLISGRILSLFPVFEVALKLEDLIRGEVLIYKAFQGPREADRYMIHRFVDQAVEKMAGFKGVAYSRLAFVRRTPNGDELLVMDYDHFHMQVVYKAPIILTPRLSPSGRFLAFVSYERGRPEVMVLELASARVRRVSAYPGLNSSPVWHPDEKRLVVTLSKDGSPDLYLIDLKGRILKRLTYGEGINTGGSFSPDGKYLAFVSDRSGSPQIYIYDFLTGGTRRLTFSGRYNVSPSWSPTGDRIVYAGNVKGRFVLFTLDPEGGPPVAITEEGSYEGPVFGPNGAFILAYGKGPEGRGLYLFLANGAVHKLYLPGDNIRSASWARLP